ncbi:MAG: Druantia anti-phage system protein DruA [Desulfobaccales bacterium]
MSLLTADHLRGAIIQSLRKQGYRVEDGVINLPKDKSKDDFRALNELAIQKKLEKSGPGVRSYENRLLQYIANGVEVIPEEILPKIVLVERESEHELLFRYACLHWSIPVSAGYGRRLRFLVFDENNGKLIGLFGLGDPVYSMRARDQWIGWEKETKANNLYHVMDAYVLGAVPPYSVLLCGKLVAMLVCSNEVRKAFRRKYIGKQSLIRQKTRPPHLALVTTTSALGRSSIYNRINISGQQYWTNLGFTQGSGDFHFSNGVYDDIRAYVEENCEPTAKHVAWGTGFRNKREVIRKCLSQIGLSADLIYHGIHREIFAAPLGSDAIQFLKGEVERPCFYDWPASVLSGLFKGRWLLGRAERKPEYREYSREQYRLWPPKKMSQEGGS